MPFSEALLNIARATNFDLVTSNAISNKVENARRSNITRGQQSTYQRSEFFTVPQVDLRPHLHTPAALPRPDPGLRAEATSPMGGTSTMRPSDKSGRAAIAAAPAVQAGRQTLVHLLSGGLAAGGVRAALLPLDTVKTRLQAGLRAGHLRAPLLRGARGLYRGVVPGIAGIVPAAALYMAAFQTAKGAICDRLPRRFRSVGVAMAAGLADLAASLVRVPCERLKQRLQVGIYTDVRHALADVARRGDLRVLYSGLNAQLARDIPVSNSNVELPT